jgi:hypothetical protein
LNKYEQEKSEESPIFRFRGYPSFSVGKGFRNFIGSGLGFSGSGPDFDGCRRSLTVP